MFSKKTLLFVGLVAAVLGTTTAAPDSAGIVEMVNGLAYGGIPYGSVSGMLQRYPGTTRDTYIPQPGELVTAQTSRPVVINPNLRATRLLGQRTVPVQIRNTLGVVAPGVVGTVSQIGW